MLTLPLCLCRKQKTFKVQHRTVKLCLDNLGGDVLEEQLQAQLTSCLPQIQKVELVTVGLGEGVYRAGWAVITVPEESAATILEECVPAPASPLACLTWKPVLFLLNPQQKTIARGVF
jgi:hypothetical protein